MRSLGCAQDPPMPEATPVPTFWRRSLQALEQPRVTFMGFLGLQLSEFR